MAMIRCRQCGNWVSDYAPQCNRCGSPIARLHSCPNCGMAVSGSNANCPNCGYRLGASIRQTSDSPRVIDHSVKKSNSSDLTTARIIATSTIVGAIIVAATVLFLTLRDNNHDYADGGGGSVSVSSSGSSSANSPIYVRPSDYNRDNGYHSSGNPGDKFQQEMKRQHLQQEAQKAQQAYAKAKRKIDEEQNEQFKQQVWQNDYATQEYAPTKDTDEAPVKDADDAPTKDTNNSSSLTHPATSNLDPNSQNGW